MHSSFQSRCLKHYKVVGNLVVSLPLQEIQSECLSEFPRQGALLSKMGGEEFLLRVGAFAGKVWASKGPLPCRSGKGSPY